MPRGRQIVTNWMVRFLIFIFINGSLFLMVVGDEAWSLSGSQTQHHSHSKVNAQERHFICEWDEELNNVVLSRTLDSQNFVNTSMLDSNSKDQFVQSNKIEVYLSFVDFDLYLKKVLDERSGLLQKNQSSSYLPTSIILTRSLLFLGERPNPIYSQVLLIPKNKMMIQSEFFKYSETRNKQTQMTFPLFSLKIQYNEPLPIGNEVSLIIENINYSLIRENIENTFQVLIRDVKNSVSTNGLCYKVVKK